MCFIEMLCKERTHTQNTILIFIFFVCNFVHVFILGIDRCQNQAEFDLPPITVERPCFYFYCILHDIPCVIY